MIRDMIFYIYNKFYLISNSVSKLQPATNVQSKDSEYGYKVEVTTDLVKGFV